MNKNDKLMAKIDAIIWEFANDGDYDDCYFQELITNIKNILDKELINE